VPSSPVGLSLARMASPRTVGVAGGRTVRCATRPSLSRACTTFSVSAPEPPTGGSSEAAPGAAPRSLPGTVVTGRP
jgi:hypothetical protein